LRCSGSTAADTLPEIYFLSMSKQEGAENQTAAIFDRSDHQSHTPTDIAPTAARFPRVPELRCRRRRISRSLPPTPGAEPQMEPLARRTEVFVRRLGREWPLALLFSLPLDQSKKVASPASTDKKAGPDCLGRDRTGEGTIQQTCSGSP